MYAILDKIVIDKNGNIGIGTMMPICSFDASQKTDCIIIPSGYENEKPLIPYDGMLRVDKFEFSLQIYRGGWSNFGNIVPTILGVSQYNLVSISTETIITGTNFEPSMEWEFIGADGSRQFPIVTYTSSNQVTLTRPDIFPTSNSPYTLHVHSIKSGLDLYHNILFSALSVPIITSAQPQTLNINTSLSSFDISYNFIANQLVTWSISPTTYGDISSNGYLLLSFPRYSNVSGNFVVSATNDNGTASKTWSYNITNPPLITSLQPQTIIQSTSGGQYDISYNFTSNQDVSWSIIPITYGNINATGELTISFPRYTTTSGTFIVTAINILGISTRSWNYNITNIPIITSTQPTNIIADTTDNDYDISYNFIANQDVSWSIIPTTYGDISSNGELTLTFPQNTLALGTYIVTATGTGGIATQSWNFDVTDIVPDTISGGTYIDVSGYRIRTFTSSSTLIVSTTTTVDLLLIGGGGGGGGGSNRAAGGGAAGGVVYKTLYSITAGTYPITIGSGGTTSSTDGTNGVSSQFSTIIAIGGGLGNGGFGNGGDGGSGGGGSQAATNGGNALQSASASGGFGSSGGGGRYQSGGGGGGATGTGVLAIYSGNAGNGGAGYTSNISGISLVYAGGGGGGTQVNSAVAGTGGTGGGGNGGKIAAGNNATYYGSGGGGGGSIDNGGYPSTYYTGGTGYQGILIIKYPYAPIPLPVITSLQPENISVDTNENQFDISYNFTANRTVTWSLTPTTYGNINSNTGYLALSFPINTNALGTFIVTATGPGGTTTQSWTYSIGIIPDPISGGTYVDASGYRIRTFTSSDTLVVSTTTTIDYLIVAGGGGGGTRHAGGGGAGGGIYNTGILTQASYNIIIGGGGVGKTGTAGSGGNGDNSSFFSNTAIGGGGGAASADSNGRIGGSGGGGNAGGLGGSSTSGQGNNGGAGATNPSSEPSYAGGGGGGAGQVGGAAVSGTNAGGGNGGAGYLYPISISYYGGGGGGSNAGTSTGVAGTGGIGGGGAGSKGPNAAVSGTINTGGGGGAGGFTSANNGDAGNGGSGIVIVRYNLTVITSSQPVNITADTSSNPYTILYNFTSNQTVTWSISPTTYTDLSSNTGALRLTFPIGTNTSGTYTITATSSIGTATQSWTYNVQNGSLLYSFTTNTFTNATATGRNGPTLAQIQSAYSSQSWASNTSYLNVTIQGIQDWKVPVTGTYSFIVGGAAGGNSTTGSGVAGGLGNVVYGTVALTIGDIIKIIVGQRGGNNLYQAGGSGGSFVFKTSLQLSNYLFVAGGGGGSTHTAGGGGGSGNTTSGGSTAAGTGGGTGGTNGTAGAGGNGSGSTGAGASGSATTVAGGAGSSGPNQGGGGGGGAIGSILTTATFIGGESLAATPGNLAGGEGGFGGGASGGMGGQGGGGAGAGGGYSGGGGGGQGGWGGGGGGSNANSSLVTSINTSYATNNGQGYVTITKL